MKGLFRPADRSPLNAIGIILGSVVLLLSTLDNPGGALLIFRTMGAMFLVGGIAEWLPAQWRLLSGGLRILSIGCALIVLAVAFVG